MQCWSAQTFTLRGGGSLEPPSWNRPPPQKAPMTGPPKPTHKHPNPEVSGDVCKGRLVGGLGLGCASLTWHGRPICSVVGGAIMAPLGVL